MNCQKRGCGIERLRGLPNVYVYEHKDREQSVWAPDYTRLDSGRSWSRYLRRARADGGDISTVSTAADVAATMGIERDRVRDGIESAETKANLRDGVAQAGKRGVFGSPFIVVDGEAFWGADRPCMVERWLKGGW